jgi:predicted ATPase
MLQRIHVNGFRSLQDFSLELRPGLNVLVGPNGAGKSNILRFFEFVSFLSAGGIPEAVSRSGGAGEIFYRLASDQISQSITFSLMGNQLWTEDPDEDDEDDLPERRGAGNTYLITYRFDVSIRISDDFTSIYYDKQRIRFDYEIDNLLPDSFEFPPTWKFDFEATADADGGYSLSPHAVPTKSPVIDSDFNAIIKSEMMRAVRERMLTDVIGYSVLPLARIDGDFSSGQPFNINPAKVREPEDIAQAPYIRADGRGVASTLFSLRNTEQESQPYGPFFFRRRQPTRPEALEEIKEYIKLVNQNIIDIDVRNDTFDNKLKVYTTMRSEGREIVIPLSLLSDGTVKWLSLVTAIVTGGSIFSLEEPENFLHPRMQIEIVGMIREAMERQHLRGFAILTTHSETILNYLDPSEVIVITMELSRTEANRVDDAENLRTQIKETGFGLGFFYVTGTI